LETHTVGKVSQVSQAEPYVVQVGERKFGIYKLRNKYFAYENECTHQGGPIVEGELIKHNECDVAENGRRLGERLSNEKFDIVCPWHGIQYDLETGVCTGDNRRRLTAIEVLVDGEDIKLRF
jgi:nitrite reductase/ring-hydroxylating ferredoxin subunit